MEFNFENNVDTSIKEFKPVNLTVAIELYGSKKKTRIQGLDHPNLHLDLASAKAHLKILKNTLKCNGGIDKKTLEIHLFGDHKDKVVKYLVDKNMVTENQISFVGVSKNHVI